MLAVDLHLHLHFGEILQTFVGHLERKWQILALQYRLGRGERDLRILGNRLCEVDIVDVERRFFHRSRSNGRKAHEDVFFLQIFLRYVDLFRMPFGLTHTGLRIIKATKERFSLLVFLAYADLQATRHLPNLFVVENQLGVGRTLQRNLACADHRRTCAIGIEDDAAAVGIYGFLATDFPSHVAIGRLERNKLAFGRATFETVVER